MSFDPVTGVYSLEVNGKAVALRFTNSAYAYLEAETGAESGLSVLSDLLAHIFEVSARQKARQDPDIRFSLFIPFMRSVLRAAKLDPDLVDQMKPAEIIGAATALAVSTIDRASSTENPQGAAGQASTPAALPE